MDQAKAYFNESPVAVRDIMFSMWQVFGTSFHLYLVYGILVTSDVLFFRLTIMPVVRGDNKNSCIWITFS